MTSKRQPQTLEEVAEYLRDRELSDIVQVAKEPAGRRFIMRLLNMCGTFGNPFTGNSKTFYNCGMQAVGQELFKDLMEADPDLFPIMQRESLIRENDDARMVKLAEQREADGE
ncbi:hypothetical protein [Anaeroselena agilis]|uniref:Bbp19-like phage domain-containing protein n=1 Tax=Anaeroselena agilis TaxID=3063788 RepID=A0ABU3P0T5_9FIRM|nr:hypothetical protein [Selenomonadales bacterium 4137-cl]